MSHRGWSPEWLQDSSDSLAEYTGFENSWAMWSGAPRHVPFTSIWGHRRKIDNSVEESNSIDIFHFIRTGKEIEAQDFSDNFLEYSTYAYPSFRWEKGLGDEWETYLENAKESVADSLGTALCNMVNEDLEFLNKPKIDMIEIVVHERGVSQPYSETRFTDETYEWDKVIECD